MYFVYTSFTFYIGTFTIKNIKATPEGESAKVKVKVRVNLNGILTIASASLIEKREPTQQEKEEEEAQQQQQQNSMDVESQATDKKDKSDQDAQTNEPPTPEVCNFVILLFRYIFLNITFEKGGREEREGGQRKRKERKRF